MRERRAALNGRGPRAGLRGGDDEHGQLARGLGGAGVLSDEVVRAGRLVLALFFEFRS